MKTPFPMNLTRFIIDLFNIKLIAKSGIIISILCALSVTDTNASHFRGGTLSWQQAGGNTITFALNTQWRRGFFGNPLVGQTLSLGTMNFGNGSVNINAVVTSVDIANDIVYTNWTQNRTYASPGNYAVSALNACCRISTLLNGNNDVDYRLQTIVNVGSPFNNPPVTSLPPVINLPVGASAATFTIPGTDPDNNSLTYRLSSFAESGLVTPSPLPAGSFVLSPNGVATMNTIGKAIGNTFALQVMIEDGLTKTAVDFLIKIVGPSAPPIFTSPALASVYNVTPPGNSVNFTVSAQDPDVGQFVTLNPVAVPVGSSMTPTLPVSGPVNGVASSGFAWTPTVGQVGTYVVNFVAQDDVGIQALRSVTINVLCPLDATANIVNTDCLLNNGSISVTPVNYSSMANLVYSWSGPAGFVNPGNVSSISGLAAGTYNMRIDDIATGCFIIRSYDVLFNPDNFIVNCRDLSVELDANGQASIITDVNVSQLPAITKGFLAGVCPNPAIPGPTCDCPDGYVVTGYSADLGNGWGAQVISRYKLHCTELLPNGTLGANTTITCENGSASGTSVASANAPAGEVVVGMQIRIGCAIDRVTGFSKSIADIIATTSNAASNVMSFVGGTGGSLQTPQYAPDGHVIVGMQTYTDNSIAAGVAWRYSPVGEVMNIGGTALSDCGSVTGSFSPSSFDCSDVGANTVVYTATNSLGNTTTCSFTVTVVDNEALVISCPVNITVSNDPGQCSAVVNYTVSAQDNCPIALFPTEGFISGSVFPVGTTTNSYLAIDASGNWDTCSFTVTVNDSEAPVVTCTSGTQNTSDDGTGDCTFTPFLFGQGGSYGISDNCSGSYNIVEQFTGALNASVTWNLNQGGTPVQNFPAGVTNVLITVTDQSGNTSSCSYTTTIIDDEDPIISCPSDISQGSDLGSCGAAITFAASVSDNCAVATIVYSQDPGTFFPVGTTTVTVTATDIHGNSSVCSFDVTVTDNEDPAITCPADVEFCFGDPVVIGNATATDNCGSAAITNDAPGSFAPGTTIVNWTATDATGNSSSCSQSVTVHLLNGITSVVDVLCYGENTGSITVTTFTIPSANPVDILYSLDGGITTQASNVFGNLYAGNYTITVINTATNCSVDINAVINQPSSPVAITVTSSSPSCFGVNTGTATAAGSGGTPGYTYEWENAIGVKVSLSDAANSLSPGTYTVIVTDANGCTATATTTITELPQVIVDLGPDKVVFYGALGFNGCHSITSDVTGATPPLSYSWSATDPNPLIASASGSSLNVCVTSDISYSYTVIITDANGCTGSATVNVIYTNIDCSNNQNAGKVTICQVPPGNPSNCKTICVAVSAAGAILANGGYVGPCLPNCAQPTAKIIQSAPGAVQSKLNIYPNPASSSVQIEYVSEMNDVETIMITDLQGRLIESINIYGAFEFRGNVDVSNFDNGIYFVNIMNNRTVLKTAKLVKTE